MIGCFIPLSGSACSIVGVFFISDSSLFGVFRRVRSRIGVDVEVVPCGICPAVVSLLGVDTLIVPYSSLF